VLLRRHRFICGVATAAKSPPVEGILRTAARPRLGLSNTFTASGWADDKDLALDPGVQNTSLRHGCLFLEQRLMSVFGHFSIVKVRANLVATSVGQ
jgi:hypothetical protein